MNRDTENLRTILEHFEIRSKSAAAALNVHPSMVTRWMNGERLLGARSRYLEPLADFILSRNLTHEDTEWLRRRFAEYGIKGEFASMSDIKRALMVWLITDPNDDPNGMLGAGATGGIRGSDYMAKAGMADIAMYLSSVFATLERGSLVFLRVSGESLAIHDSFIYAVRNAVSTFGVRFRMLLSLSARTKQPFGIITAYLSHIVNRDIEVSVVFEDTAAFTEETIVIVPGHCVVTMSMINGSTLPPTALLVQQKAYVSEMEKRFVDTMAGSQPLFASLELSTGRKIHSLSRECYELPGSLMAVRNGLNSLYMYMEGYEAFLKSHEVEGQAYDWRLEEFCRGKDALDKNLKSGMTVQEIIPTSLLRELEDGNCVMSGQDFMETGEVQVDKELGVELIEGYVRYLNIFPNFSVRIIGNLPQVFERSEWLIKESSHVLIKSRRGGAAGYLYSQQLAMVQGVSTVFRSAWGGMDFRAKNDGESALRAFKSLSYKLKTGQ